MSCPVKRSPSGAGRASVSGHEVASHPAVTERLTGSPPSSISLILKRILLKTGIVDRRKRRNYRGRVRRVKLGGSAQVEVITRYLLITCWRRRRRRRRRTATASADPRR